MTPKKLREWADAVESGNWPIGGTECAASFRAYADLLERYAELEKILEEARDAIRIPYGASHEDVAEFRDLQARINAALAWRDGK